jgi:adenylate cyclase
MTVRIRIGTKVFALAISLLSLSVALSIFGAIQAREMQLELREIAEDYIPLDNWIQQMDGNGLRGRLAFEKWRAALDSPSPDAKVIDGAYANYRDFIAKGQRDLAGIQERLDRISAEAEDTADVARIRTLAGEVRRDYPVIGRLDEQILEQERQGNHAAARELEAIHVTVEENMQARRDELGSLIASLTERSAVTAQSHENRLLAISSSATGSAILFGIILSWVVTRRLVNPVRSLMAGVEQVEKGDLTVEVPVTSSDEIGVLTVSFNRLVDELRAKERMKETFGKYIDPRIVEGVILNPTAAGTEGGRREMTVSFCDLVGFTTLGEDMTPTGLVRLLNRHFSLMSEAIQEHRGVLDKFIGDAVMAFWGPPFCGAGEHAEQACRAALSKLRALEVFRAELPELTGMRKKLPTIDLRVGLASGEVVVGNIGSDNSRSYTVIGDTVNLASRLESINRLYGTRILINETTRSLTKDIIEVREVDTIAVKGKTESVRVFEVMGMAGEVPVGRLHCRDGYEAGLAAYRQQNWQAAENALQAVLAGSPGDGPAKLLFDRIALLRATPPAVKWDGVWRLTEK